MQIKIIKHVLTSLLRRKKNNCSEMSLRKFMHPRNIYKKIPDFKKLVLLYPEFRDIAIVVSYIFEQLFTIIIYTISYINIIYIIYLMNYIIIL